MSQCFGISILELRVAIIEIPQTPIVRYGYDSTDHSAVWQRKEARGFYKHIFLSL